MSIDAAHVAGKKAKFSSSDALSAERQLVFALALFPRSSEEPMIAVEFDESAQTDARFAH